MSEAMKYPGVGCGVWICRNGKILLGRRIGKSFPNTWCVPGGKLELWEDLEKSALREVQEETSVEIGDVHLMVITNDMLRDAGTHFVTLHYMADWKSGEPQEEPGKLIEWQWFTWGALPEPLFPPTENFLKTGINPLEYPLR